MTKKSWQVHCNKLLEGIGNMKQKPLETPKILVTDTLRNERCLEDICTEESLR